MTATEFVSNRKGDWLQTATGKQMWPLDPRPEEIDIGDIAHALSNQCRYSGHTLTFYSVAQHSVLVSFNCPRWPLYGLLHDAAETYLVDLPRPVKKALRAVGVTIFDEIEYAIMRTVWARFGLPEPDESNQIQAEIDVADILLLATEARDLMSPLHPDWHHQEKNGYPVLPERVIPWTPGRAKLEFLSRFDRLRKMT